ncbi:MAG: DUF1080 domain-containing protein [Verrucomicrobiae bacterium]|nr:DUF1080 domain-containing protein [Verrucomicrobiae bacterium]
MKSLLLTATTAIFAAQLFASPSTAEEPELKSIFNGKDLSGWKVPADNIWWKAADGILSVQSGPKMKGSILQTEQDYSDFVVEVEFKFGKGTVDSGIFIRNDKEQIQIGISGSLKRDMTASPYIPGKGYPVEAEGVKELLKLDDWNTLRVEVRGGTYISWLNGKKVMTYTSDSAIEKGPIGLQLHPGKEMAIEFRNLKATELKKS